jgi:hypothetical protein
VTARRQALSPRGRPPRHEPARALHPLRAGYLETALGAVAGSIIGGWVGEWIGSRMAQVSGSDAVNAAPLFIAIAGGLWLGAVAGGVVGVLVFRRRLALPTGVALLLAGPAMASAVGVLQTMFGMGPSFLPYVLSTLVAGLAARFVVLRVFVLD